MAKKEVDIAAYVANRDASDNALAQIREIRANAKAAKEAIAGTEGAVKSKIADAGGRLVVGGSLLEFTKGGQVRVTTVVVA